MKMEKQHKQQLILAIIIIVIAALLRLPRYIPNFSPIAAMALFGGAVIKNKKLAFLLPLGALLLSDTCFQLFTNVPGFYSWGQLFNYGAFLLIVLLGTSLHKIKLPGVIRLSILSSVVFYIISNFGVWVFDQGVTYPHTAGGLISCYVAAIPFFGNTLIGDLFYCGVLFGGYYLVNRYILKYQTTH
jgi:Family of unknown function (DUF6580)